MKALTRSVTTIVLSVMIMAEFSTVTALAEGVLIPLLNKKECSISAPEKDTVESVVWTGKCVDNKPEGEGVLTWHFKKNGAPEKKIYSGNVEAGIPSGFGTEIFQSGSFYKGEFRGGERHGKGAFTFKGYGVYDGEFKDGLMSGQGIFIGNDGNKYDGGWQNGKPHGQGRYATSFWMDYEGEWNQGCFRQNKYLGIVKLKAHLFANKAECEAR